MDSGLSAAGGPGRSGSFRLSGALEDTQTIQNQVLIQERFISGFAGNSEASLRDTSSAGYGT